jgi:hypothetical protein
MQARMDSDAPRDWIVLPLLRSKVVWGIVGWFFGILLGLGLFALLASIVIPYNYQRGVVAALFSTILLGIPLFIGLGSAWSLLVDVRRLRQADKHLIVITPEAFVKQEGDKIIHVPLMYVRHITARGAPPPDRTLENADADKEISGVGENVMGFFMGRGFTPSGARWRRKRMRTPTSLAFIDSRTDSEVIVTSDGSYGDPFLIAAYLKQYAATVQHIT